ncbi:unnamed protein product [Rotaria sordida]|uniref:Nuclear receptor domain-containing protein n=1 Tax=Rotaria sordida TaxID=392033 RepID=A0A814TU48_9BILA|nr:unnamed protein product [Rotaria sordida]
MHDIPSKYEYLAELQKLDIQLSLSLTIQCRICGVPAEYSYFGVISCNPCKMFFKRNANAGQVAFVCNFDGQCEININNRHICSACRLAKCFKCGMSTDKFRTSRNILAKVQAQRQLERSDH